ncbi:MAG: hypothetical protein ACW990_17565 [Promethearchaeota archaeon]|jgi:hypothetical protein
MSNSKQVNVRIPIDIYKFFETEADRLQNKIPGIIRLYLKYGLEKHNTNNRYHHLINSFKEHTERMKNVG